MRFIKTMLLSSVLLIPILNTPAQAGTPSSIFDIDGDGESKALTDGLLLLRYLFGFNGANLTSDAVGMGAPRNTSTQIIDYIENPPSIGFTIRALNDTGITDNTPVGSDGTSGRDVTHNDDSDGHAGFSFTKLSDTGAELAASAANWSCVKDNVTGLIWEAKTTDGGVRDATIKYTWYNPFININGGHAGIDSGLNDTDSFVSVVNVGTLCGASDWRTPTVGELGSIADLSKTGHAIDTAFFPNTRSDYYWSSTSFADGGTSSAWTVHFGDGTDNINNKSNNYPVRLVRSGQ